jgi:hypothetical protein
LLAKARDHFLQKHLTFLHREYVAGQAADVQIGDTVPLQVLNAANDIFRRSKQAVLLGEQLKQFGWDPPSDLHRSLPVLRMGEIWVNVVRLARGYGAAELRERLPIAQGKESSVRP